jgi:hypothetical protein
MNRYMAQNQYEKKLKRTENDPSEQKLSLARSASKTNVMDVVYLKQLQVAAELERQQNEQENRKILKTPVHYGNIVQLLHLKSNKYLTVHKRLTGQVDKHAMRVTLEANGNEGSWLQIQPCYKHRTLNDAVFISDKVNLFSVDAAQILHTSAERLHDNPGCTEVNVAPGSHSWKIFLYFEYNEAADDFLKVRPPPLFPSLTVLVHFAPTHRVFSQSLARLQGRLHPSSYVFISYLRRNLTLVLPLARL